MRKVTRSFFEQVPISQHLLRLAVEPPVIAEHCSSSAGCVASVFMARVPKVHPRSPTSRGPPPKNNWLLRSCWQRSTWSVDRHPGAARRDRGLAHNPSAPRRCQPTGGGSGGPRIGRNGSGDEGGGREGDVGRVRRGGRLDRRGVGKFRVSSRYVYACRASIYFFLCFFFLSGIVEGRCYVSSELIMLEKTLC